MAVGGMPTTTMDRHWSRLRLRCVTEPCWRIFAATLGSLRAPTTLDQGGDKPAAAAVSSSLFSVNLTLVRATGFWRRPAGSGPAGPPASVQRTYFALNVACNLAFVSSKLVHTVLDVLDTASVRRVTENLSDVLCIAFSLLQLLALVRYEDRLAHLMAKIDEQFLRVLRGVGGGPEGWARQQAMGRRITVSAFVGFLATGLQFAVIVAAARREEHTLPIRVWTPFPQDGPGTLSVLLLVEATGVILTVAGSGALSALFLNSFLAVESQFRALRGYFRDQARALPDGAWTATSRARIQGRLTEGIKLHQDLVNLADQLCEVLAPFLTVQLGTIVFMLCIALFQISTNPLDPGNLRFVALAATVTVESFVLCWMGTRLSDEAMGIQQGLQSGDWCLQGKDIGYIVWFAVMRSQKPPSVVVGRSVHVGLPLFLEMIRSSYSLLAFLQKRARKEYD